MTTARRLAKPTLITDSVLRRWPLPALPPGADKQTRGDVLVVGGSREMPGAALLAGVAALRAGAGRVRIATARTVATAVAVAFPEARVLGLPESRAGELTRGSVASLHAELEACGAVLVGPGMRDHQVLGPLLRHVRQARCRFALVLDAAALRSLQGCRPFERGALTGVVATPHAGEMAELWGCPRSDVKRAPLELAREAARTLDVFVVLKGTETLIVAPDGTAFRNLAGNVGLATAGSGDTLAGLIAGLAARGADPFQAAVWGVYLHARAGDRLRRKHALLGYLSRELSDEVPRLLGGLSPKARSRHDRRAARE